MRRIILMFITNFFKLPYLLWGLFHYGKPEKYSAEIRYGFMDRAIKGALRGGRVKVVTTGIENLPAEGGYVIFPNHQGMFDVMAFMQSHKKPLNTVMKKENRNVPLLKRLIPMFDAEVIDRDDIRQSMTVIQNMTRRVKAGEIFVIFAEGTRSKRGNLIGSFKGGSFKSAMNAHCPIVPAALIDSFKPFDVKSIKKVTVQLHYMKPLYYEDYKGMKSLDIAKLVSNRIKEEISKHVPKTDPASDPNYETDNEPIKE